MAVLPVGIGSEVATGDYQIERSLRFNSADSAYLNRTPGSAGNLRVWTWSGWFKKTAQTHLFLFSAQNPSSSSDFDALEIYQDTIRFYFNGTTGGYLRTNAVYRDPSAWYHIVASIDTTQATASNRIKLYVNGVQVTGFSTATYPSQNYDTFVNNTVKHTIGATAAATSSTFLNGYLTEIHHVDGQALDPTSFGEFNSDTGVWQPIEYTGTYGNNGFYLDFADNSGTTSTTLGKDSSGNGNNWTPNNFSVTAGVDNDSLVDSPMRYGEDTGAGGEVRGNYCTWNPIYKIVNYANSTITNGNLYAVKNLHTAAYGSMAMSTGKWYWEVTVEAGNLMIGIIGTNSTGDGASGYSYNDSKVYGVYPWSDIIFAGNFNSGGSGSTGGVISFTTSVKTLMFAYDADDRKFWFGVDGTWVGNPAAGTGNSLTTASTIPSFVPWVHSAATTQNNNATANFGQRPFAYTAPSGFKALCTTNLPAPTIADGSQYFNPVLYTGNSSTQSITGVNFQPDFVWIKDRQGAENHCLFDRLRNDAAGTTSRLNSDTTGAEATGSIYAGVSSFDTDGFTLGANVVSNRSGRAFVSWNWKANGSGVNNTAGSISSTVSANTDAGLSIVTWSQGASNQNVGHGLGVTPAMIIGKTRSNSGFGWHVFHQSLGVDKYIFLNLTNAASTSSGIWSTLSSTTFGASLGLFEVNQTQVAYCFAPVAGYSAFGSYTGNGSTDGPFVFTNHRPAFLLIKATGVAESWYMVDNARNTYNVVNLELNPNNSGAEATYTVADFLSNGFKLRQTDPGVNQSGQTYIYAAFAENPFAYSLAR